MKTGILKFSLISTLVFAAVIALLSIFSFGSLNQVQAQSGGGIPTVIISVNPSEIQVGESATISWITQDTDTKDNCTANPDANETQWWTGEKGSEPKVEYTEETPIINTPGVYVIDIVCSGPGGTSAVETTTLTVGTPYQMFCSPATTSITIGSTGSVVVYTDLPESEQVTLSHTLDGDGKNEPIITYDPSNIQNGGDTSTLIIDAPEGTAVTQYTMTISGSNGTGEGVTLFTCDVMIDIENNLPSVELSVNPSTIDIGQTATISWITADTEGGNACVASANGDAGGWWKGDKASDPGIEYTEVTPIMETDGIYTLYISCTGPTGVRGDFVSFTVGTPQMTCNSTNEQVAIGSTGTVEVSNNLSSTDQIVLSHVISPDINSPVISYNPSTTQNGGETTTLIIDAPVGTDLGDYALTISGSYGVGEGVTLFTCEVLVTITSEPSGNINCNGFQNSCSIPYGDSATINWSSTDTTACSVSIEGDATLWSGTSGSESTGSLTSSTTYILGCEGSGGVGLDPNPTVTVTVGPDFTLTCDPLIATITSGDQTSFVITNTPLNGTPDNIISHKISPSTPTPPVIDYSPSNELGHGKSITAIVTTDNFTTPETYTITFTGIAVDYGLSRNCVVTLEVQSIPPDPPDSIDVSNTGQCGQIDVTLIDEPNNPVPAGYRIYRRTEGTGTWTDSWTQLGADIEYVQGATNHFEVTISDTDPLLLSGSNYYGARAFNPDGTESNLVEPSVTPIVPRSCTANINNSDIDLVSVAGAITQTFAATACNNTSDVASLPNNALFSPKDVVTFQINICNSGESYLSATTLDNQLYNLTNPQVQEIFPADCAKEISKDVDSMELYIERLDSPSDTGIAASFCRIIYTAVVEPPLTSGATIYFFQSVVDIINPEFPDQIFTPPYRFSVSGKQPTRAETAP